MTTVMKHHTGDTTFVFEHFVTAEGEHHGRAVIRCDGEVVSVPIRDLVQFVEEALGEKTETHVPSSGVKFYLHGELMLDLEKEYEKHKKWHRLQRRNDTGIRSPQISALVMLLIDKGVLK